MYFLFADDLTGACDAGVTFAEVGTTVDVALSTSSLSGANLLDERQMLAINSCSRNLSGQDAKTAINNIVDVLLLRFKPDFVYKKIDSTMRGNVGEEIDILSTKLGINTVFITPAAPEHGRIVRNGQLFVNGQSLEKTNFAHDPLAPVATSSLVELLKKPELTVVITLDDIAAGVNPLADKITSLINSGYKYFVFDAETFGQLEIIAKAGIMLKPLPLFAGSAGLARALAPFFAGKKPAEKSAQKGPVFFVCGSAHKATHKQIKKLEAKGIPVYFLSDDLKQLKSSEKMAEHICNVLQKSSCVLSVPLKRLNNLEDAASASHVLADLALDILKQFPSGSSPRLCITGGETAFFLLSRIARYIRLEKEIEPGVVESVVFDGSEKGMTVITKAGGFGDENTLLRVNNLLY